LAGAQAGSHRPRQVDHLKRRYGSGEDTEVTAAMQPPAKFRIESREKVGLRNRSRNAVVAPLELALETLNENPKAMHEAPCRSSARYRQDRARR
jgi:hypothetical protein